MYRRCMSGILHLLHRRLRDRKVISLNGLRVQVCPDVFHPGYGQTTGFFIRHMVIQPGERVLEIGTGTGAIAAAAALQTQDVVATDVNPFAVKCAQGTMRLNQVDQRVSVLLGDLFAPVQGEAFDVVLFNPPYFDSSATSWVGQAWAAGPECSLIKRFLIEAHSVLKPGGNIQMLLSSAAPVRTIKLQIKQVHFQWRILAEGRILGALEHLFLLQLW
jgi:release factor glutamine methyltransferase